MKNITILICCAMLLMACKEKRSTADNTTLTSGPAKIETIQTEKYDADAEATEAVVMREQPGINAKKVTCTQYSAEADEDAGWKCKEPPTCERQITVLPKGYAVMIIERTTQKVQVKKWNNYWYKIKTDESLKCKKPVWVFGEFIKEGEA